MSAVAIDNAYVSQAGAHEAHLDRPAINGHIAAKAAPPSQKSKVEQLQEKYAKEREKRLRDNGTKQWIDLAHSSKFKYLANDCWAEKERIPRLELNDDAHTKVLIVGGGFGGLLYAVRFIEAGIDPKDIIIADTAGGYGGTWYWNRYPGLMCDVESYIYLPLLEETKYVPKHKYSYGTEIRDYANLIAKKWNLEDRGAFQQSVEKLDWNEDGNYWEVQTTDLSTGKPVHITADFVIMTPGLLNVPKLFEFKGTDTYKGHHFHTARWDYEYTGGSPDDPSLTNLKGKRVGIIGTGATAIQAVPHLAKWAKELYIFQRTPSAVDRRDQRPTDPEEFSKSIASGHGWQWERTKNFNSFLTNKQPAPAKNLVDDGWCHFPGYSALMGTNKKVDMSNVADHVSELHMLDIPRSERVRDRVNDIVQDTDTAEKLKAWYPGWCKRPCFHDEYLQTFNQSHVHLVDTDGKGIDRLTEKGIVANNNEYDLDCIIFSTGYNIAAAQSPTARGGITAHGRDGKSLDDKWTNNVATLHGVFTHDFPNLIFSGPTQATASANFSSCLDLLAQHAAYIVSTATKKAHSEKPIIEPTEEAEEEWTMQCMMGAAALAGMAGCTPSYLNGEGDADRIPMEMKMKSARMSPWASGMNDYADVLETWRKEGSLRGLQITAA